jgi:hypothetical protein
LTRTLGSVRGAAGNGGPYRDRVQVRSISNEEGNRRCGGERRSNDSVAVAANSCSPPDGSVEWSTVSARQLRGLLGPMRRGGRQTC